MKIIKEHIAVGENEFVEFKTSFNKETIETLVAFSNAKGGKVLLGVTDKKEVVGLSISEESIQQWINQVKQATYPQLIPEVETVVINKKNGCCF